jgi:hypothetical protein
MKAVATSIVIVAAVTAMSFGCAACATGSGPPGSTATSTAATGQPIAAAAVPAAQTPVLPVSAVPGITVTTHALPATLLAKDAAVHGLAATIHELGYRGGLERIFQGMSKQLTFVQSRALVFADPAGAASYLALVRIHADQFFGDLPAISALTVHGRSGLMFRPQECACHEASPVVVGIVQSGSLLEWLEINGPTATPSSLTALLGQVRA